jgi:hypothetical protein
VGLRAYDRPGQNPIHNFGLKGDHVMSRTNRHEQDRLRWLLVTFAETFCRCPVANMLLTVPVEGLGKPAIVIDGGPINVPPEWEIDTPLLFGHWDELRDAVDALAFQLGLYIVAPFFLVKGRPRTAGRPVLDAQIDVRDGPLPALAELRELARARAAGPLIGVHLRRPHPLSVVSWYLTEHLSGPSPEILRGVRAGDLRALCEWSYRLEGAFDAGLGAAARGVIVLAMQARRCLDAFRARHPNASRFACSLEIKPDGAWSFSCPADAADQHHQAGFQGRNEVLAVLLRRWDDGHPAFEWLMRSLGLTSFALDLCHPDPGVFSYSHEDGAVFDLSRDGQLQNLGDTLSLCLDSYLRRRGLSEDEGERREGLPGRRLTRNPSGYHVCGVYLSTPSGQTSE